MFGKSRLEAFSDGVLAIILTIMVLELKTPTEADISSLLELGPKFFSYILSFIYIGIYWNNHHHMFSTVEKVNGKILWANFNLLFWLSLIPFSTSWMGETKFSEIGTFTYGVVLFMAAVAYFLLESIIIKSQGENSKLKRAVGNEWKGKFSVVFYFIGIIFSIFSPYVSLGFYILVAAMWIIPDKRIEKIHQISEK